MALIPRPKALVVGTRYLSAIDRARPKEPSWSLFLLAADPSVQRSGIGTGLQQAVLDRTDADGLPAYLEAQNVDNLAYYRRFGYEVGNDLHPVPGGPPLWTVRLEPRALS